MFGGAVLASQFSASGGATFGGAVSASQFAGSGAGLTSLPAGSVTGTLALAVLPSAVALRSDPVIIPSATTAAIPTCGAGSVGQVLFNTTTARLWYCDGASWRTVATDQGFAQRTASTAALSPGAALTLAGFSTNPVVTVWQGLATGWLDVTGNSAFPVTYTGGTVTVVNGSGATVSLMVTAAGL